MKRIPNNRDETIEYWAEGGVHLRTVAYDALEEHGRHCHDTLGVTLIMSGTLEETTRTTTLRQGVCSVVVKPPDVQHANRYGPRGTKTFQLTLERSWLPELAGVSEYRWYDAGPVARAMVNMLQRVHEGELRDKRGMDNLVIDLMAVLGDTQNGGGSPPNASRPIAAVREYLDTNFASAVSVRELANSRRIHPVSLARAFRRHYGCSISDYVRRRRILEACRRLDGDDATLAGIAADVGFADQPHLTRAFNTELGVPPGRYRRLTA